MDAAADLSFVDNYKSVRARLNNPPRPKEIVCRKVEKSVTLDEMIAKYRLAFDGFAPEKKAPSAKQIMAEVCNLRKITRLEILSGRRFQKISRAKHEIMWRLRHETSLSYPQIGGLLGGMAHTSIMHGVRLHQARIDAGEVRP